LYNSLKESQVAKKCFSCDVLGNSKLLVFWTKKIEAKLLVKNQRQRENTVADQGGPP
jgi:hypothetical protein